MTRTWAAGERVAGDLEVLAAAVDDDIEGRKHVIFALSRLPAHAGVPVLIRIAREHRDPRVRKQAIFWLGRSGDPRALVLLEELLTTPTP